MASSQKGYVKFLAEKYNFNDAKLYDTPIYSNLKLHPHPNCDSNVEYRNLIEPLYISTGTTANTAYIVNYLCTFQTRYVIIHYK